MHLLARSLIAALAGLLLAAGAASADTLAGSGSYVDRFGWTYMASVEAQSGPHGEEASGTLSRSAVDQNGVQRAHYEADVSCLTVRGGRATAIGALTFADPPLHAGQGLAVTVEDGGNAGPDRVAASFPRMSDPGGLCPIFAAVATFATLDRGGFAVQDDDPDRVPPVVSIEGDLAPDAEGPDGGWVSLHVTAVDDVDGDVPIWCDQNQGGLFPIGTHVVTCFASDLTGNTGSATVQIVVQGAAEQIADLRTSVAELPLPAGHARELDGMLAKAGAALSVGVAQTTCDLLLRFERDVAGLPQKKLSDDQVSELQADAERIRSVVACPS